MNNLHNIASLHRTGVINAPQAAAGNQGASDLPGFLSEIVRKLQAAPQGGDSLQKTQAPHADLKGLTAKIAALLKKDAALPASLQNQAPDDLAAKIAALLQKNNMLPAALQNLPPDDLSAKIAALLQTADAVPDSIKIKPAMTSDLAAALSPHIQGSPKNDTLQKVADMLEKDKSVSNADLTKMLNEIQPGSGDDGDIAKILAQLQAQPQDTATIPDPSILQQLKDKIDQLQLTKGEINNDALVQFKADLIQSLKDQGMDQPTIQHYLTALAKFLRHDDAATEKQPDQPAAAVAAAQPIAQQLPITVTAVTNAAPPQHTAPAAPKALVAPDSAKGDQPVETAKQDTAQRTAAPPAGQKDDTSARPQPAVAATPPAPSPQQNLSAKIAGCSINANMINALANSDGGFSQNGFGAGGDGQPQDLANSAGLLKPATVEHLNAQNFTNYLTSARTAPSAAAQMVSIQMQRNINAKMDTMTLQLEPADLGRLDIKMKFDKDGGIKAHLTVDKPETLALLQKDSYYLEKVLQKSGLGIDENSLSFDLRQQNPHHNLEGFNGGGRNNADEFSTHMNGGANENTLQAKIAIQASGYITQSGVNIMV